MVYCYLSDSYSNLAHKQLFDAAAAALRVDAAGLDSLLLGHQVVAADAAPLDAVVLRPHSITLLIFVPRGGLLSIPALGYGSWLLDGVPLSGLAGFDNPFEHDRSGRGKGYARKLRTSGKIPAVLNGKGQSTAIELDPKLLPKAWQSDGRKFTLAYKGKSTTVRISELQIDPVKRLALHVDLQPVD